MRTPPEDDFVARQNKEVQEKHAAYKKAANKYTAAVLKGVPKDVRIDLLTKLHSVGRAYFSFVDSEILNRDGLSGDEYARWVEEWSGSSKKVLNGIIRYHDLIRDEREKVGLPASTFEPSDGTYRSIQSFFAAAFPVENAEMKERFIAAKLPSSGFDRPYMQPPRKNTGGAASLYFLIVIAQFVLSFAAIVGGIFALASKSSGDSMIEIFGQTIKTQNVGVALVGLGLLVGFQTLRKVLDKQ